MQIKRDYSNPLFGPRKQRRNYTRWLFAIGVLIGILLVGVIRNFDTLQETALGMVGYAPTPTPLPSDLATVAMNYVTAGDFQSAADLFEQAVEQRPDNIDYLYEYGQLRIEMDDPDPALELADRILGLAPGDPRGYALKGRALIWVGNSAAAIPVGLAGLDLQRGYESALHSVLARAYTDTGQYENGVEHGLLAVEADSSSIEARRSYAYALSWVNRNEEAIDQLETAISLDPNRLPAYFELALQYLAQNRDEEAIDLYDRILAIQPRNARAQLWLCRSYRKIGQFERAVGYCEDAIDNDPTSVSAYYELGILKYNRYDFRGALDAFNNCVLNDPTRLECTYRLGLSYYYLDDCDTAWDILQQSLRMAQSQTGVETAIEHIRQGLVAIGQKCPEYSAVVLPPAEATAEATSEPDVDSGG